MRKVVWIHRFTSNPQIQIELQVKWMLKARNHYDCTMAWFHQYFPLHRLIHSLPLNHGEVLLLSYKTSKMLFMLLFFAPRSTSCTRLSNCYVQFFSSYRILKGQSMLETTRNWLFSSSQRTSWTISSKCSMVPILTKIFVFRCYRLFVDHIKMKCNTVYIPGVKTRISFILEMK